MEGIFSRILLPIRVQDRSSLKRKVLELWEVEIRQHPLLCEGQIKYQANEE
jgi:hypothetical protein